MALFGKPKRTRGPAKSGAEQLKMEQARAIRYVRKNFPELYAQKALELAGIVDNKAERDPLEEVAKTIGTLKELGLFPKSPKQLQDDNGWLKELGAGIAEVLKPMVRGQVSQLQLPQGMAAQAEVPRQPAPPQPPAAVPGDGPGMDEEEPMHPFSRALIAQLDGKEPREAAQLIAAQPQASQMVAAICGVQDGQLMEAFGKIADANPPLRGWVNWLRLRETWVIATVRELRRITEPPGLSSI